MPVAIPTCRKVELIPDAAPLRRGSTTPIAVVARAGLVQPMPIPATMKPGSNVVQSSLGSIPLISSRPMPTSTSPDPMNARAGSRSTSLPVAGATRKDSTETGRNRTPASRGE
jgi:hypothetical protein